MRLIDADALEEYLNERLSFIVGETDFYDTYANGFEEALERVEQAPTIDAEPVRHEHWIEDGDYQICSGCGDEHSWDEYRASYCECCGAKMDEVRE